LEWLELVLSGRVGKSATVATELNWIVVAQYHRTGYILKNI